MDMVQKVSAIVATGTSTGSYSGPTIGVGETFGRGGGTTIMGGYTTLSGWSQSELSRRLASPQRPQQRPIGCWFYGALVFFGLGAFGGLLQVVFGGLKSAENWGALFFVLFTLLFVLLGGLGHSQSEQRRVERELPAWEAAMDKWNRLFYCHRCDGVFVPGQSLVPSRDMQAMLRSEP